ncbi:MAG: Linoleoyl-CoA desaturase, partial [uncultured Corynebacteriales bacterium]
DRAAAQDRQPDGPPDPGRHRGHRPRAGRHPGRGGRQPRRAGRRLHPAGHRGPAGAGAVQPAGPARVDVPAGLAGRHDRPVDRQDPGEHGDRPQRHARPVGLDARPGDPLHHLGVGQRHPGRAVEAQPQRAAPRVHERAGQGQRPRLRDHAGRRGPALGAGVPAAAAVERAERDLLPVRHRRVRPRGRQVPQGPRPEGPLPPAGQEGAAQGAQAGHPRLPGAPAAVRALRAAHPGRQPHREPRPQPVDPLGDHVRALPVRGGDLHQDLHRGRDPRRLVSAADARRGQHQRHPAAAPDDRQPVLPDRAPSLPGPAEQPLPGDRAEGARPVRPVRAELHHRAAAQAGRLGLVDGHPALPAQRPRGPAVPRGRGPGAGPGRTPGGL